MGIPGCSTVDARRLRRSSLGLIVAAVALFAALLPGRAAAEPRCDGGGVAGVGTEAQARIQNVQFSAAFNEVCGTGLGKGIPGLRFNSDFYGSGEMPGLRHWDFSGERGSVDATRYDAFVATNLPPAAAQIENIERAAPGTSLAVVPVAQAPIVVLAHPPQSCVLSTATITNRELERIFRGIVRFWSEIPGLHGAGCQSPVTRVVPGGFRDTEATGVASQFKHYLGQIHGGGIACTVGGTDGRQSWFELQAVADPRTGAPNTTWPTSCPGQPLSPVESDWEGLGVSAGRIGFSTLAAAASSLGKPTPARAGILAIQNNGFADEGATFAEPLLPDGTTNCAATPYTVPAAAHAIPAATGLDVDWSQVYGGRPNAGGTAYPLCMLTYVLALSDYPAAGFAPDVATTVHDYLAETVLQPAGQERLEDPTPRSYFNALPTSPLRWQDVLGAARLAAGGIGLE